MSSTDARIDDPRAWHDAEHASYGADLPLLTRLAARAGDPVVDLGAGTGRVALHLAARGRRVIAVERDASLAAELQRRARDRELPVEVVHGDARELDLPEPVPLVIAPMQFLHIVGGRSGRQALLRAVADALAPGGSFVAAILADEQPDELPTGTWRPPPIPDVREVDGWVHSSLCTKIEVHEDVVVIERLRQLVSPDGELSEEIDRVALDRFSRAELAADAAAVGLETIASHSIPPTREYEGATIVVLGRQRTRGSDA